MKKIIIPLTIIIVTLISVTFATSSNFNIDKIDFFNNSKMAKIYDKIADEYRIKEPTLLSTKNETKMADIAVEAISILFGAPNQKNDNDYFASESRISEFIKYCYKNSDLPKDENGNIQDNYKYYELDENNQSYFESMKEKFKYDFQEIFELNMVSYSKIEIVSITPVDYGANPIRCNVTLKLLDFIHYIRSPKTGELIEEIGTLTIEIDILKSEERLSVLYFRVDDIVPTNTLDNSNSLVQGDGYIYDNSLGIALTSTEIENLNNIYNNYYKSIFYLSEVNQNNVPISSSIGFCFQEGIVIANWTWFEKFLLSGNELLISDYSNNVYEIDGIVTISKYHDFVVLKLMEEVDLAFDIKLASVLNEEKVVALTSNKGINVIPKIGNVLTVDVNAKAANLNLKVEDTNVGAPVFSLDSSSFYLSGFINSNLLNSSNVQASQIDTELYDIYLSIYDVKFEDIKVYKLKDLVNEMYFDILKPIEFKNLENYNKNTYKNYFKDLKIEEIYLDSIASIDTSDNNIVIKIFYNEESIISKKQYMNLLTIKLIEQGYKEVGSNDYKTRFKNEKYNITIKYESGYIVIVGMEN